MLRCTLLLSLLLAAPALAKELKGVKMADAIEAGGKKLTLNGMGLRTKAIFKVYVAGLYLEEKSSDPAAIIAKAGVRRVDLQMLRDLEKGKITEAIKAGFEKNSGDKLPALKDRLEKFCAVVSDLKEGQVMTLIYVAAGDALKARTHACAHVRSPDTWWSVGMSTFGASPDQVAGETPSRGRGLGEHSASTVPATMCLAEVET